MTRPELFESELDGPPTIDDCPACGARLREVDGCPGLWYCPNCPEEDEAP